MDSEATVNAETKIDGVNRCLTRNIEDVGVFEFALVTHRGTREQHCLRAGRNCYVVERHIARGRSALKLRGRIKAQDLFHGARQQARVLDELLALAWEALKGHCPV